MEKMKEPLRTPIDHYIRPNKILCSMIGMWPIDEKASAKTKAFAYFRLAFALTAVNSVFLPEISAIIVHWGDLKVLTGVGCVSTTVGQLVFKMVYLLIRKERVTRLYTEVRSLWDISEDPTNRISNEEFASWAKLFTVGFYLTGMCNVITFTIAAGVEYIKLYHNVNSTRYEELHLPFEVWYGVDALRFPTFEIAFICQVIASLICCAGICGLDATFMTLILHVCRQFKLIQKWLNDIPLTLNKQLIFDDMLAKLKTDIAKCVQHHQRVIRVVHEVNNLLSPIIFVQLLTSGLEICLSGYAVLDDVRGADLLKFISYLLSMLIQLLLWCWPAEILIRESLEVGNITYFDIPWYELPPSYRKQLCLVITRAQRHSRISTFAFQTLSISTLTGVFNKAASYFTLLRKFQES